MIFETEVTPWSFSDTLVCLCALGLLRGSAWLGYGQSLQALGLSLDASGFILVWWFTLGAGDRFKFNIDGEPTFRYSASHIHVRRTLSAGGAAIVVMGFGLQFVSVTSLVS